MGTPALHPGQRVGDPAPLPLAFLGRCSTAIVQDPVSSLRRQARSAQEGAPPGSFIAAWFWDIESGGLDLEARGHGSAHERFDVGLPRDGGIADLLAEAASPNPRFAAVICEDIERSGRDTFNALKLERQLADAGIPLFAADEPIDVEGMNATTILVRRVKQGIAEWYRFQIKEKAWKGLREHALDGWNIGPAPYGYTADRVPHPVPVKAAQGRTKTRLVLDPQRGPVVAQIYTWRTVDRLGVPEITGRLNADHGAYPPPDEATGWTNGGATSILSNPKYTGHVVFGRRRTQAGKRSQPVPQDQWPVDSRAGASGDRHPGHLGGRPEHRRRAWNQPRRAGHPPARPKGLPAARPRPLPPLQAAHARHHPPLHPVLQRRPRRGPRLLPVPPRPAQPPPPDAGSRSPRHRLRAGRPADRDRPAVLCHPHLRRRPGHPACPPTARWRGGGGRPA